MLPGESVAATAALKTSRAEWRDLFSAPGKFQRLPRFIPVIYPVNTETGSFGFQNQPPILPRRLVPKRNCRRLA